MPERRELQFVYRDGDGYVFVDPETLEEFVLPGDRAGAAGRYLVEHARAHLVVEEGRALGVELPEAVELAVVDSEPRARRVTLETGLVLRVPAAVAPGERVAVDTRTGRFLGRVSH